MQFRRFDLFASEACCLSSGMRDAQSSSGKILRRVLREMEAHRKVLLAASLLLTRLWLLNSLRLRICQRSRIRKRQLRPQRLPRRTSEQLA